MNCEPNALSRASSPLRALTEYQLGLARLRTLCAWAGAVTSGGTPGTPTSPDISAASNSDNVDFMWANGSPVGTTNEIWKSTDGTNFVLFATVAGGIIHKVDNTIMAAGNIWYYKVRSCNGTTCSAFSAMVSVANVYTSPNVASISFPTLIRAFGIPNSFVASGLAALTSVSLPALKSTSGNLNISANPNLTTVTLTSFQQVVNGGLLLGANKITGALSLPALTLVNSDLQFQSNAPLTSFSAPLLATVGGNLVGFSCLLMTSVTFTSLATIGQHFDFQTNNALTSLSFPALISVGGDVIFNNCPVLASVSFPVLASVTVDNLYELKGDVCPLLVSLSIPQLTVTNDIIELSGDGLNAASINQILARGVASGVTACQFNLSGGTSAAPSGQGVVDKATLIGLGNTVNTN